MSNYRLIELVEKHLPLVFQWRNSPLVRENMYINHEISLAEHQGWFERVIADTTKEYFIFELDGEPCGVIGFMDIDIKSGSSSWAFYSGDTARRGVGSLMEIAALNYAFDILKLRKLNCEVIEFNEPVIKFHKKHGFKVEGILRRQYYRDERYWDIYRLAIFDKDWLKCKEDIVSRKKGPFTPGTLYTHNFLVTHEQIVSFATVTGDCNDIHLSDEFAMNLGFSSKIVHGFLSSSIFSKVFGTLFPGEGTIYLDQSLSFLQPIYPDMPLEANFKIMSKVGRRILVETTIHDVERGVLLVKGEANLLLPIQAKAQQVPSV
jgi:UDP-4-amino-4,6-dideoxy-N-acetyl-beta-L-altrosamine N-acetyltransferase